VNASHVLRGSLVGLIGVMLASSAPAYDLIRHGEQGQIAKPVTWNPGPVAIQVKLPQSTVYQDGTTFSSSVVAALQAWNEHLAAIQFSPVVQAAGFAGSFNGLNEVTLEPRIYSQEANSTAFGPNVLAVTLSTRSSFAREDGTYTRTESDVIFNSGASGGWNSYRGNLQSPMDVRRVAIHEFGHVLGLDHPNANNQTVQAIMNSTISHLDALQPDDIIGAQFQYGRPGGFTPPANDNFAAAAALTLNGTSLVFDTDSIGATKESGEPNHAPDEPGGASVWWRWTANAGGRLLVNTSDSHFDTMLAAYTGTSLGNLTQLAANDDVNPGIVRTSTIAFDVVFGTTYYIAVDGWDGEWGTIRLSLNLTNIIAAPQITTAPAALAISVNQSGAMNVAVSGAEPFTYRWQVSAGGSGPWTDLADDALHTGSATAQLTFPAAADNVRDGNAYRCVVTNHGGQAVSAPATLTVNRLAQQIAFAELPNRSYSPAPVTLSATATSGLPVAFAVVSGPAALDGAELTLTGIGAIVLQATQPGNTTHAPAAPVERSFTVSKGQAEVVLSGLAATYNGSPRTVTAATSPAGLSVSITYDGGAGAPTNAGSYAIAATVNDSLYEGAASGTLVVARAPQTITFPAPADRAYTSDPVALGASSSSGLAVSYSIVAGPAEVSGASLQLTGAGVVTVRASEPGDGNHLAAPDVERSFTVSENFDSWRLGHFDAGELADPLVSGPGADPDGDGLANLLEYALGLNPHAPDTTGLPVAGVTETDWIFTYTRPSARGDIAYTVEASTDLATWDSTNVTLTRIATGETETWRATVPTSAGNNLFFRLRVTRGD
jgi:hypothetical protein